MQSIIVDEPNTGSEVFDDITNPVTDEAVSAPANDFTIPDKFSGKSDKDIAKAYVELEKELGRKANEVGELRRLTDEYLRRELSKPSPAQTPQAVEEDEEVDFFVDPKKSVSKAVDANPKIRELEERLARKDQEEAIGKFEKKHPDYQAIGGSEEFQEWVGKSQYRARMFERADALDLEAADELLTMWKDFQKVKAASTVDQEQTEKRKRDLKAASGESNSTGESRKKVYSRVDLMRLRVNDPDKYNEMSDEIITAYREGRVK